MTEPNYDAESLNPIEEGRKLEENSVGGIYKFSSWRIDDPSEFTSLDFSEFRRIDSGTATEKDFFLPDLLRGSDYAGTSIHRSNYRVFMKEFGEVENIHELCGDYELYGVAIRLDVKIPEMWKGLLKLADYPILDEFDLSALELEEQGKAWRTWAGNDYRRGLEEKFKCDTDPITDDRLSEVFGKIAEENNLYWNDQPNGEGPSINIRRIIEETPWKLISKNGAVKD